MDSQSINQLVLDHSLQNTKSVLALTVSSHSLFVAVEGGQIFVFDTKNYRQKATLSDHRGSVLALLVSPDESLLFSSAADRFVNIWDIEKFQKLYSIYSTHDLGDIYCVAYSKVLNTIYLGAQNASIQWYNLNDRDVRTSDPTGHPFIRKDRFFDSPGPGGSVTPRPDYFSEEANGHKPGEDLEIDRRSFIPFAHYGYVYCMIMIDGVVIEKPGQNILVSGGGDGSIKLWSLSTKLGGKPEELFELELSNGAEDSVLTIAQDGSFLISGRMGGQIDIWDLETRHLVRSIRSKVGDVRSLSVGSGFLFVCGSNGSIDKFNSQYERKMTFSAHDGSILASTVTTDPDKPSALVTGGTDCFVHMWNIADCNQSFEASNTSDENLVDKLGAFVSFKTVSADKTCKTECLKGASFLRSVFKDFGAETRLLTNGDSSLNPVVYAFFKSQIPSKKVERILFYGHYDVIPAENDLKKWRTDPFHMKGVDEYLYGRGTSDNKGPLIAAIYAVAELIKEKKLGLDIVFLIEGEEECGSRGFQNIIRTNKKLIGHIDWILLANSYWLDDHVPCLTYGLRGVIHATLEVVSNRPDLHSGVDGSSLMDESLKDLVMLLNTLVGKKGRVTIPKFYESVLELSPTELDLYQQISKSLVKRDPSLGDPKSLAQMLLQKWRQASLTIHRFGTSGPENSTVIPSKAWAKLSLRLVPNQEAKVIARQLIEHLENKWDDLETTNELRVTIDHMADPWLGDRENVMYKTLEEAIMDAWSDSDVSRPFYIREGGTIPAIRFLEKEFEAPAAHMPCGQASDHAHLDNERLRLLNLYKSRDVFKWVFRELPKKISK